jgi:hypothetical protein
MRMRAQNGAPIAPSRARIAPESRASDRGALASRRPSRACVSRRQTPLKLRRRLLEQ